MLHLQLLGVRCKELGFSKRPLKEIRKCISQVLKSLTTWMNPETFFKCIAHLLDNDDWKVIKKVISIIPSLIFLFILYYCFHSLLFIKFMY